MALNCKSAEEKLQISLNRFKEWCDVNALNVNIAKTKVMAFGSRSKVKKCKNVRLRIDGEQLQMVPSFKYLGLILDSTLNFTQHIASVIKNIAFKMSLLAKIKRYLNDNVALQIYKSMLLPYFDYGDVIFCKANERDLGKLQTLQNKCLKICTGKNRRFSTELIHKNTNVPFLNDMRKAHLLNFMYLRKKDRSLLNTREIRTRAHDAPLFIVPVPRSEAFKRSVSYFGSVSWNNLLPVIRNTDSFLNFKKIQKSTMLQPLNLIRPAAEA